MRFTNLVVVFLMYQNPFENDIHHSFAFGEIPPSSSHYYLAAADRWGTNFYRNVNMFS